MVEDFKAWQYQNKQRKTAIGSVSGAIWALTVAFYFVVSFSTGAWHISWIIFLIAFAVNMIIKALFDLKAR